MTFDEISRRCEGAGLTATAAFHPNPGDEVPVGCQTLLLLGPREPGFWARIRNSPEFGRQDPLDRWSERIIGTLADECCALPFYPFTGPPYRPFVKWALASGDVWQSPVGLLIDNRAGLFVSIRGALAFERRLDLPAKKHRSPCETCLQKPCQRACPAGALKGAGYDVALCHAFLDTREGETCLTGGCLVRLSCPISQRYGRLAEQSAHHMQHFHERADE